MKYICSFPSSRQAVTSHRDARANKKIGNLISEVIAVIVKQGVRFWSPDAMQVLHVLLKHLLRYLSRSVQREDSFNFWKGISS